MKNYLVTEEEIKEIERVYQKPIEEVEWFEIPTYIRNRDEDEARALSLQEEQYRQKEKERKEREIIELNK